MQLGIFVIFGFLLLDQRVSSFKSCNIKPITSPTRNHLKLSYFYQKSINVNGILILGSNKASISSMKRACYILHFILAESEFQIELSKKNVRVVIMASNEYLANLPELNSRYGLLNIQSARNFTAKIETPIIAIGEELVMACNGLHDKKAKSLGEPFIYSIIYSILSLNAVNQSMHNKLINLYSDAKARNLWTISHDYRDYFANGVEVFFNTKTVNPSASVYIQNDFDLKIYDIELYSFIQNIFYCNNTFTNMCQAIKDDSILQALKSGKKCESNYYSTIVPLAKNVASYITTSIPKYPINMTTTTNKQDIKDTKSFSEKFHLDKDEIIEDCQDSNLNCDLWFKKGECQRNPQFMHVECKKSCNVCTKEINQEPIQRKFTKVNTIDSSIYENYCKDDFSYCPSFAGRGDCKTNPHHMLEKCKRSCNLCGDLKPREKTVINSSKSYSNNILTNNFTTISQKLSTNQKNLTRTSNNLKNLTSTKTSKAPKTTINHKDMSKNISSNLLGKKATTKPCADIIDYCLELAQRGDCLASDSMKIYCSKTCKFC